MNILIGLVIALEVTQPMSKVTPDSLYTLKSGALVQTCGFNVDKFTSDKLSLHIHGSDVSLNLLETDKATRNPLSKIKNLMIDDLEQMSSVNVTDRRWGKYISSVFKRSSDGHIVQILRMEKNQLVWIFAITGSLRDLQIHALKINDLVNSLSYGNPSVNRCAGSIERSGSVRYNTRSLFDFISKAMKKVQLAGLSIGVIEDEKLCLLKHFGSREFDANLPIDNETRFLIGSATKPLTTLMISKIVGKRILNLDDIVQKLFPNFKIGYGEVGKHLSFRSLINGGHGYPRHDLPSLFDSQGKRANDLLNNLKHLKLGPDTTEFNYNNQVFSVAGYLVSALVKPASSLDLAFQETMSSLVFSPLSMNRTTTEISTVLGDTNYCKPGIINLDGVGKNLGIESEAFSQFLAPAGGVWSTVEDLAKFLIMELRAESLSPDEFKIIESRREPNTQVSNEVQYGLGWFLGNKEGLNSIYHTGTTAGFYSSVLFVPEINSGVILLANGRQCSLIAPSILDKIFEIWLDKDLRSQTNIDTAVQLLNTQLREIKINRDRITDHIGSKLIGQYRNEEMGNLEIYRSQNNYFLKIGKNELPLEKFNDPIGKEKLIIGNGTHLCGILVEIIISDENMVALRIAQGSEYYDFLRLQTTSLGKK